MFVLCCTDEFHQKFVPNRTSNVGDVLIDFGGRIVGATIFYILDYVLINKRYLRIPKGQLHK